MIFPPKLERGDLVALVSPSSPLTADQPIETIASAVESLGFRVWIGDSCRCADPSGYAAAPAAVRARDINAAFGDPGIRAIWCTRGGSTAWRLLPLLDYELIAANPKPFIGFSDVTTLHMALQQRCGLVTFHGPTANRTLGWERDCFSWPHLLEVVNMEGDLVIENPPEEPILALRPGQAAGELTGGNLSLVAASLGTPWQVDARDRILYLEDVGEAVYALERMLDQLRRAGVLDAAAGVVLGAFTSCRNAYREDYGPLELLRDFFSGFPKPVLCNVRSAHCSPMVTLPMGAMCRVDGERGTMAVSRTGKREQGKRC